MAIIGWTSIGAVTDTTGDTWLNEAYQGSSGLTYTAVAGDRVTEFAVYGAGTGLAECAIYTVVSGVPTARVGAAVQVTIGATAGWHTAAADIALTAGTEYTVAIRYHVSAGNEWTSYFENVGGTNLSDMAGSAGQALPATWTVGNTSGYRNSFYATVAAGATTIIRPDGDVSRVGWVDEGAGTTNLWGGLDEATASDADFVTVSV